MADFTIELRDLIENDRYENIGLNDYPIFDESYRAVLNQRIIDHYYYYEIGHETPDIFIRQMRTKMREIMPYYNKLYESTLIDFDPLTTQDVTTTLSSHASSNVDSHSDNSVRGNEHVNVDQSSTTDNKTRAVNSEMPQVRLAGNEDYATSAVDTTGQAQTRGENETTSTREDSSTMEGTTRTENNNEGSQKTLGRTASAASLINEYRSALINVDLMIIAELQTLFMQIWSSQDAFTEGFYYYG